MERIIRIGFIIIAILAVAMGAGFTEDFGDKISDTASGTVWDYTGGYEIIPLPIEEWAIMRSFYYYDFNGIRAFEDKVSRRVDILVDDVYDFDKQGRIERIKQYFRTAEKAPDIEFKIYELQNIPFDEDKRLWNVLKNCRGTVNERNE